MELGRDYRDLIELLNRHGVRYLAVGGYEPNRVDFLTNLTGVEFAEAYPMRVSTRVGDLEVPVIDRASLIANKRALGRPRDLDDAKDLEQ